MVYTQVTSRKTEISRKFLDEFFQDWPLRVYIDVFQGSFNVFGFRYNDADLNWETFNSPRFFGNFRANNHEGGYFGLTMNMTCHEPLDFPTKTLKGNECLNWKKYIYIKTIDQYGFEVQHLRDEVNLQARIFYTIR